MYIHMYIYIYIYILFYICTVTVLFLSVISVISKHESPDIDINKSNF